MPDVEGVDPRRNTTALPGRTTSAPPRTTRTTEHPASARGLGGELRRDLGQRNTPASAGRTTSSLIPSRSAAEHPRVGREDFRYPGGTIRRAGAPRVRRGRRIGRRDPEAGRNTPALAGRTRPAPEGVPRSVGAPPRRRGERTRHHKGARPGRSTPASAGRTAARTAPRSPASEHPRVGGEDDPIHGSDPLAGGTPPRRRGGRGEDRDGAGGVRNTPASSADRDTRRLLGH